MIVEDERVRKGNDDDNAVRSQMSFDRYLLATCMVMMTMARIAVLSK